MATLSMNGRGSKRPNPEPENLSEEERSQLLKEWQEQNPFAPASAMPSYLQKTANGGAASPATVTKRAAPPLPEPSEYLRAALAKPERERTPQEVQALKERRRAEEITLRGGGKVNSGITPTLIAEQKGAETGAYEASAALAYNKGKNETLRSAGLAPDGTPLPAEEAAPQPKAKPTSGGTIERNGVTTEYAGSDNVFKSAQPAPKTQGYAMRTMDDGTVRTASGVDQNGRSNMRDFGTKEEALAFYQPPAEAVTAQPKSTKPQARATETPAMDDQGYQGDASAPVMENPYASMPKKPKVDAFSGGQMGARKLPTEGLPSAQEVAASPGGFSKGPSLLLQDALSSKTTAPTTKFNMANKTLGTPLRRGSQELAEDLNPFASSI